MKGETMKKACVVMHKPEKGNQDLYLWYKTTNNKAHLITRWGKKFSGTPSVTKLKKIKELPTKEFNGHWYVSTKIGVFSMTTGNMVVNEDIIKMFRFEKKR